LVYVAQGSGLHIYKGSTYVVSKGDVFLIEPGSTHTYHEHNNNSNFLLYNVLFYPSILKDELRELSKIDSFLDFFYIEPFIRNSTKFQDKLSLQSVHQLEILNILEHMVREYNDGKPGYQSMVKAKLIELLISISRCYEELITKPMTTSATDIEIINRTAIFIQSHFHQPLSLSQISQICGMSKTSFSLKFKKYYGQTFIEYRNELRIHKACQLLTSTNMKIVSVAHQVGFNELSNFNRVFRQYTNTSPGQYREDNKRKI